VRLLFYTRYFPGWTATIDGAPAPIEPFGEQGLIAVDIPAGTHLVATRWSTTPARIAGGVISLLSIALVAFAIWRTRGAR
jgi:hypothetical protein